MSVPVYTYEHKGVFTLKITGRNDGRYEAYCERIGVAVGSEESKVEEVTPAGFADLIKNENIGAIPLLPGAGGDDALVRFIGEILEKETAEAHLGDDIPTRGTTVIVGPGFSESTIPTLVLDGNGWPSFSEKARSLLKVPIGKVASLAELPRLVRLRANNHAEVIVKVLSFNSSDSTHRYYNIEWTPEGQRL